MKKFILPFLSGALLVLLIAAQPKIGNRTVVLETDGYAFSLRANNFNSPFISRYKTNGTTTITTNFYVFEYTGSTNVTWHLPSAASSSNFTCVIKNGGTATGADVTLITAGGGDVFNPETGGTTAIVVPFPRTASSMYSDGVHGWKLY